MLRGQEASRDLHREYGRRTELPKSPECASTISARYKVGEWLQETVG
jgi:hypothetical protein